MLAIASIEVKSAWGSNPDPYHWIGSLNLMYKMGTMKVPFLKDC